MDRERPALLRVFNPEMIKECLAIDHSQKSGLGQVDGKDVIAFLFRTELKGNLFRLRLVIKFHIFAVSGLDGSIVADLVKTNQSGGQDADDGFITECLPLTLE